MTLFGYDTVADGALTARWWAADHIVDDGDAVIDGRPATIFQLTDNFAATVIDAYEPGRLLIQATRRDPDWAAPHTLTAGDAVHLRWLAGSPGHVGLSLAHNRDPRLRVGGQTQLLMSAAVAGGALHWVAGPTIEALLESDAPPAEAVPDIRLPFRTVTVTWAPLLLDHVTDAAPVAAYDDNTARIDLNGSLQVHALVGVTMRSRPDNTIDPHVVWLTAADTQGGSDDPFDRWALIPGDLPAAVLGPLALNVAALLSWGAWADPPPLPPQVTADPGTREWAKQLRKSASRKAVAAGAGTGVRAITIHPDTPAGTNTDTGGHRKGPRPHIRRGHWRRVASGPGRQVRTWRWLAPTIVAAHNPGGVDRRLRVYRVAGGRLAARPHDGGAA